jgi:hypothetical protein
MILIEGIDDLGGEREAKLTGHDEGKKADEAKKADKAQVDAKIGRSRRTAGEGGEKEKSAKEKAPAFEKTDESEVYLSQIWACAAEGPAQIFSYWLPGLPFFGRRGGTTVCMCLAGLTCVK